MTKWTVLVYMAGDTGAQFQTDRGPIQLFGDLSGPLKADLEKIAAAGSTDDVAVCAQYDSFGSETAYRWVAPKQGDPASDPQAIGAVNTGQPASLSDFVAWAGQRCPADRYALVIWGHGSGWSEDDLYARFPGAKAATRDAPKERQRLLGRGIFASSAGQIMKIQDDKVRGLCYDDSSRDFLDNRGLQQALSDGAQALGRERIDVLGLDACLMCMVEVAHQVRGLVGAMVGTETLMPTDLWPWSKLLSEMQARPDMPANDVALLMAGLLPSSPNGTRALNDVCQAALDLTSVGETTAQVDAWSRALLDLAKQDAAVKPALTKAISEGITSKVLRMQVAGSGATDYVDLYDLVWRYVQRWEFSTDVKQYLATPDGTGRPAPLRRATKALLQSLTPGSPGSLVLGTKIDGFRLRKPGGVSIYLPELNSPFRKNKAISPEYANLDFAATAWKDVIALANGM
jgi:hypothetical protein